MGKNVTTIPATINMFTYNPINTEEKRRVAGYARVSTDMEEQQTSYAAQCDYYTHYIKSHKDWIFAGLYSDEGITACNTFKRDGFNKMIEDALAGKIDLIITKSVSRFARNTVDSLSTIRKLKEHGCECYFEKENIWTFDAKGELLITIMSSLAQEESRSISENCTWGWRKRCADGKVSVPFGRFLGYERGEDGNLVVNQEQAQIVRKIYGYFLQGRSPYQIAKLLTEQGIPTPGGKKVWGSSVVRSILTNEKYKGDALLQKVYTTDFLTKKKKRNEGEVPQYYVTDNHEAIIKPEVFDRVQVLLQSRKNGKNRASSVNIFSSRIKCGCCGGWYGSKVWHSNSKYRKVVWQCNHKFDNNEKCTTPNLDEAAIKEIFIKALNALAQDRELIVSDFESIRDTAFSTADLEAKANSLANEMKVVSELIKKGIEQNARVAQNQKEYQRSYDELVSRFDEAKAQHEKTQSAITQIKAQRHMMDMFISELQEMPNLITEFDESAWYSLLEFITVYSKENIKVTFRDGTEITL